MVDHYVEEAQRYHSLAMRQRLEIAYTREENQRLKVRVGVLGDQLSSALEGAMESWDDVERVQQEACGFALGAGMEIGALEARRRGEGELAMLQINAINEMHQTTHGQVAEMCHYLDPECHVPDAWSLRDLIVKERKERDAALARAERLEKALKEAHIALHEGQELHCDGCPEDDTCSCPLNVQICMALYDVPPGHNVPASAALREGKP